MSKKTKKQKKETMPSPEEFAARHGIRVDTAEAILARQSLIARMWRSLLSERNLGRRAAFGPQGDSARKNAKPLVEMLPRSSA